MKGLHKMLKPGIVGFTKSKMQVDNSDGILGREIIGMCSQGDWRAP